MPSRQAMAPKAKPTATAAAAEEQPMLFKVKQGALPAREFFMEGTEIPIADIKGKIVENAKSFNGNITLERIILMRARMCSPRTTSSSAAPTAGSTSSS